jgi:hypothetical protein
MAEGVWLTGSGAQGGGEVEVENAAELRVIEGWLEVWCRVDMSGSGDVGVC